MSCAISISIHTPHGNLSLTEIMPALFLPIRVYQCNEIDIIGFLKKICILGAFCIFVVVLSFRHSHASTYPSQSTPKLTLSPTGC